MAGVAAAATAAAAIHGRRARRRRKRPNLHTLRPILPVLRRLRLCTTALERAGTCNSIAIALAMGSAMQCVYSRTVKGLATSSRAQPACPKGGRLNHDSLPACLRHVRLSTLTGRGVAPCREWAFARRRPHTLPILKNVIFAKKDKGLRIPLITWIYLLFLGIRPRPPPPLYFVNLNGMESKHLALKAQCASLCTICSVASSSCARVR